MSYDGRLDAPMSRREIMAKFREMEEERRRPVLVNVAAVSRAKEKPAAEFGPALRASACEAVRIFMEKRQ